jgi:hypothetical protein
MLMWMPGCALMPPGLGIWRTKGSVMAKKCECCKKWVGERRVRCTRCSKLYGLCCVGDSEVRECTNCYSSRQHIREGLSINHQH